MVRRVICGKVFLRYRMDFLRYCSFSAEDDNVLQGIVYEEADSNEYTELTDLDAYSSASSQSTLPNSPMEYMQLSDSPGLSTSSSPEYTCSPYHSSVDQSGSPHQEQYIKQEVDIDSCSIESFSPLQGYGNNQNIKCEPESGRKSTKSAHHADPFLPPCRVCAQKASGFHYGANTCEACKVCFIYFLICKYFVVCLYLFVFILLT